MIDTTKMWIHLKTGALYVILEETWCYIEKDMVEAVLYMSLKDGTKWVRPKPEFYDGRFQNVSISEFEMLQEYLL